MNDYLPYHPPTDPWLTVLHEDEHIVVADKQPGLLSVPGRLDVYRDCLQSRLEAAFGDIHVVHRLDMPTSGVIVFARTADVHRALSAQWRARSVEKRYIAVVAGALDADDGRIDLPLITDWPNRPRQKVDFERGKPAETHWRVIERQDAATRVRVTPVTGRSHQIRVHFREVGHPILGDPLYAPEPVRQAADRLLLHASALSFIHPGSQKRASFHADVPF